MVSEDFPFLRTLLPKCLVYGCAPSQALPANMSATQALRTNYGLTDVYISSLVRGLYIWRWRPQLLLPPQTSMGAA